ncbi:beta-xylosidase [Sphingomonas sp. AP4-R1]|uniref:GH39 family glycosyl hydrolase n=1 Tax=Sphingomonas sp. AP4-R1 TaxID=2735134 RepID=UPI0014936E3D|nr:beta-xylosidase [Sphingomonas sp. AP4-R1]QJU56465.1 beta-xylosidase [Sphingomonas sp. AP4-R1]
MAGKSGFCGALTLLGGLLASTASLAQAPASGPSIPVTMTVDAGKPLGPLKPIWRFFGADEPNYATMKDGRKLLDHLGKLRPEQVYFRAHNLLNTGDGTAAFKWGSTDIYKEDAAGKPIYDWTIADHIIDTYRARGIHPYLQLGFMPEALSSAPKSTPYQHNWRPGFSYKLIEGGWNAPPKDYGRWAELIYQWTRHNIERYGRDEVARWYFEVWNEPNGESYWKGTPEEFQKMHDYAVDAVRRALPEAKVGGPDAAGTGGAFMDAFMAHLARGTNYATGKIGTPTDFLAFHAKGQPSFVDGHVRMGIATHLRGVNNGFAKIAAVPEMAHKAIVIGESDPEGCAACPGPQNAYRNGTMYSSYTVASFARIWDLADTNKVNLDGALTWSFTFEDQPWFAGYRQLATNGIDLPVMNVFRLFAMMGETRIGATSSGEVPLAAIMADGVRAAPDVGVVATKAADGTVAILVWNYHDDDVAGPDAAIHLDLAGLGAGGTRTITEWRVDKTHADAFSAWAAMGSPQSPDEKQYAVLEKASEMAPTVRPTSLAVRSGKAGLDVTVPRQGVMLLTVAR